jgi:ABC-2 type transport system ATP-binding protein
VAAVKGHEVTHAIEVRGLSRSFGTLRAVDGVTYSVAPGEVFGVLGPNGSGKTTMVRLLNGVLTPSEGEVHVLGLDPMTYGPQVRRQTGVLTETPSLYERLTARDNLTLFGTLYDVPESKLPARVKETLELFSLTERANDKAGGFSKGMKQRLALARALIHEPQILFLDEPTAALDPEASQQVTMLIEQLSHQGGRTVFLCTHNLDEAQRLCDRVAVINKGRLLAVGTPSELARELWNARWLDFELHGAPDVVVIAGIQAMHGVTNVVSDDGQLSVQMDSDDMIPGLVAEVARLGGQILRVNPREHSLEEIYFELQKREEKKSS